MDLGLATGDARLDELHEITEHARDVDRSHLVGRIVPGEGEEATREGLPEVDRLLDRPHGAHDGLGELRLAPKSRRLETDRLEEAGHLLPQEADHQAQRRKRQALGRRRLEVGAGSKRCLPASLRTVRISRHSLVHVHLLVG